MLKTMIPPLDDAHHDHFSEHGWVLVPAVLPPAECVRLIAIIDRLAASRVGLGVFPITPDTVQLDNLPLLDGAFLDWLAWPGLLAAARRLMESDLRLQGMIAHRKQPHPERHGEAAARLRDPVGFGWHRGLRPRWGITASERRQGARCASFVNVITYLTAIAPGDGGTAILDGSHVHEGDYGSLCGRLPVIEVTAPAGSVMLFSETLIHAGCPILSERTRYNFYTEFVQPWCASHGGYEIPDALRRMVSDPELRAVLGPPAWRGQEAVG